MCHKNLVSDFWANLAVLYCGATFLLDFQNFFIFMWANYYVTVTTKNDFWAPKYTISRQVGLSASDMDSWSKRSILGSLGAFFET